MSRRGLLFEGQAAHALLLLGLSALTAAAAGAWTGDAARAWLAAGVGSAVAHQLWVLAWWRLEYHLGLPSRHLGAAAFRLYAAGFALLGLSRFVTLAGAGWADAGSLDLAPGSAWALAALLVLPGAWLVHSIARHFGFRHALGADHFFPEARARGLCREGIFRFVPNAMYTVGFLSLWAIALAFRSRTALLLAAFQHAYIWVHYLCTERPDMRRIYGAKREP